MRRVSSLIAVKRASMEIPSICNAQFLAAGRRAASAASSELQTKKASVRMGTAFIRQSLVRGVAKWHDYRCNIFFSMSGGDATLKFFQRSDGGLQFHRKFSAFHDRVIQILCHEPQQKVGREILRGHAR